MRLFEQGARGVQLFYVASSLTLMMSWNSRNDGYIPFLIRRIFRIIPLFWLAIPVYLFFAGLGPGYFVPDSNWKAYDVIRQIIFADSLFPARSSIVPGGWTVNTEILFYTLFPILVFIIRSLRIAIVAYIISLIFVVYFSPAYFNFLFLSFPQLPQGQIAVWATLSLPIQLPVFLVGFVVFFLLNDQKLSKYKNSRLLIGLLFFSLLLMVSFAFILPNSVAYSFPLGIYVFCFGCNHVGHLINKPIIILGKVSFSAYIWHFMVLNFIYLFRDHGYDFIGMNSGPSYYGFAICLIVVTLATFFLSYISYILVELPLIRVGRSVVESYKTFVSNSIYE